MAQQQTSVTYPTREAVDFVIVGSGAAGGVMPRRARFEQRGRFVLGAIVDVQRVTSLLEVTSHAAAHDAGADEGDRLRHSATETNLLMRGEAIFAAAGLGFAQILSRPPD